MIAGYSISSQPISMTVGDRVFDKINQSNSYNNGGITVTMGPLSRNFTRVTLNNVIDTAKNRYKGRYQYGAGR